MYGFGSSRGGVGRPKGGWQALSIGVRPWIRSMPRGSCKEGGQKKLTAAEFEAMYGDLVRKEYANLSPGKGGLRKALAERAAYAEHVRGA